MRRPQLQSTFARAVVPVATGIAFFALLALLLWGVAAIIASNSEDASTDLSAGFQDIGRTDTFAAIVAEDGPIVLPDLLGDDRNVVLDHTGSDPQSGWVLYAAYPADRDASCEIEQIKGTRQFTDCEGRTIEVDDLSAPPVGVRPLVGTDRTLTLDLTADDA
jgi:hypothetical protein